jgi:m7GpppX diphosphatase
MSFSLEKVLFFDQNSKRINILASKDNQKALILLEKLQFEESKLNSSLKLDFNTDSGICKLLNQNDIYSSYLTKDPLNPGFDCKVTVIYPATEAHIKKYSSQERFLVLETPKLYKEAILPFVQENSSAKRLQWVYNILDHGAESETVLFKDDCPQTGFYLIPDSKWDRENPSSLYLLAICKRKDISSLRDFTAEHLPLLKRMQHEIPAVIQAKWGISTNKLRMFVHYHPTYYHFHLHIVSIDSEFSGGLLIGQAHLLQSIIDNIETFGSDYYSKCTIPFVIGENQPIYSVIASKAPEALSKACN